MYMVSEDSEYLEKLTGPLDYAEFQQFHELPLNACREQSGSDFCVITVRSAEEIGGMEIDAKEIITRKMIESVHEKLKGSK